MPELLPAETKSLSVKLEELAKAERDVAYSVDFSAEETANWQYALTALEARDEIERLNANAALLEREVSAAQDRIERDARHIERLGYMLEFAKQAQLTAEAETTKAMAAHAIEAAQLREEIARLRTAIDQVHNARLTWAMACPCGCKPCDEFYEFVRDTLPDCSSDDGAGCAVCGEPTPAGRTYCSEICESDATPSSSSVDVGVPHE